MATTAAQDEHGYAICVMVHHSKLQVRSVIRQWGIVYVRLVSNQTGTRNSGSVVILRIWPFHGWEGVLVQ